MKKKLIIIVVVLAILFGLTLIGLTIVSSIGQKHLDRQLAQIEDPDTVLNLEKLYIPPIPDEDNAAIGLLSAYEMYVTDNDELWEIRDRLSWEPKALSEEDKDALVEWLYANNEALQAVDEALKKSNCRFEMDFSDILNISMPHISQLRSLAKLSNTQALMRACEIIQGNPYESCCRIFRLSETMKNEPFLINGLVNIAVKSIGYATMKQLYKRDNPELNQCDALLSLLKSYDYDGICRHSMLGERASGYGIFEQLKGNPALSGDKHNVIRRNFFTKWFLRKLISYDQAYYLETMNKMVELSRKPLHEAREEMRSAIPSSDDFPWYALFSKLLLPAMKAAHSQFCKRKADNNLAIIATLIHKKRAQIGELPQLKIEGEGEEETPLTAEILEAAGISLDGYSEDLLTDPLFGEPFLLKKTDDGGYIVFSPFVDEDYDNEEDSSLPYFAWVIRP